MCFPFVLPPQSTEQVLHSDQEENPPSVRSLDLKGTCGPAPQFCKKKLLNTFIFINNCFVVIFYQINLSPKIY